MKMPPAPFRARACVLFVSLVAAASLSASEFSCDTWVALANSTRDGSVIMAKNSDRRVTEAQPLVYFPRQRHAGGATVKATNRTVPQAAETFEHIGSQLSWTWGYEHGVNEWGVAIGNEAVRSRIPTVQGGLNGNDLIRLALERGRTAYEAMHVITARLDAQGPGNNTFIIADPESAWVLETAGRFWVAKRVTDVYAISNTFSIERDYDEAHPEVVTHAIEQGWCTSESTFNFARCYTHPEGKVFGAQNRANHVTSILRRHKGDITVELMMNAICRSHHEGTIEAPKWAPNNGWFTTVCMHNGPNNGRTSATMVAHLRKDNPPPLRTVYWAAFSSPCVNVFKPFYLAGPEAVPANYGNAKDTYNADSPWWWAEKVKRQVDLNYNRLAPLAAAVFRPIEEWALAKTRRVETEAAKLIRMGREEDARKLLREFSHECCTRAEKAYAQLHTVLAKAVAEEGVDYLWLDKLRETCETNALTLPGLPPAKAPPLTKPAPTQAKLSREEANSPVHE